MAGAVEGPCVRAARRRYGHDAAQQNLNSALVFCQPAFGIKRGHAAHAR